MRNIQQACYEVGSAKKPSEDEASISSLISTHLDEALVPILHGDLAAHRVCLELVFHVLPC